MVNLVKKKLDLTFANENEIMSINRKQSLNLIRQFLERKLKVYGQKKNNDPNIIVTIEAPIKDESNSS